MATAPEPFDPAEWEVVPEDEPPLGPREMDRAFAGHLTRNERRRLYRILEAAGLVVFRA